MFEITENAARQFLASAKSIGDDSLSLRVSAKRDEQSGIVYNMGFDKPRSDDVVFSSNGVAVMVDPESVENVKTMIIDFREFEGREQFIFINPNDKKESCETSPSGCDPEGNPTCRSCLEED